MLLSEYYKDSKYSDNGRNFEVLEVGQNQRSIFKLRCLVCGDVNDVVAASVLSGRKPCWCSPKACKTPEKMFIRLQKATNENSIRLLQESVKSAKSPVNVECLVCGEVWCSSYNSLVLKKSGCPCCNGSRKLTETELLNKLTSSITGRDIQIENLHYNIKGLSGETQIDLVCVNCTNRWSTVAASTLNGSGCPKCARFGFQKTMPAYMYLLRVVTEHGVLVGYKYGITCDLHRRVTQHNKLCRPIGITLHPSFVWEYDSGEVAFDHEKNIKARFGSYFTKEELPSGFSETIDIYRLGELLDFQNFQYRGYTCQNSD